MHLKLLFRYALAPYAPGGPVVAAPSVQSATYRDGATGQVFVRQPPVNIFIISQSPDHVLHRPGHSLQNPCHVFHRPGHALHLPGHVLHGGHDGHSATMIVVVIVIVVMVVIAM